MFVLHGKHLLSTLHAPLYQRKRLFVNYTRVPEWRKVTASTRTVPNVVYWCCCCFNGERNLEIILMTFDMCYGHRLSRSLLSEEDGAHPLTTEQKQWINISYRKGRKHLQSPDTLWSIITAEKVLMLGCIFSAHILMPCQPNAKCTQSRSRCWDFGFMHIKDNWSDCYHVHIHWEW